MNSLHKIKKENINYGIQILRMILSFWVVIFHIHRNPNFFLVKKGFHVPTFIIISFYFLYSSLSKRNIIKIRKRLERLIIPYILYPLLYFFIYNLLYISYESKAFLKIKFSLLIMQLLIGRGLFPVLWFHFNLIFLTIFFVIISFSFRSQYLFFLSIICIICYFLQLSGLNFNIFNQYSVHIKFSVGYIIETMPLAVTGLYISSLNIINKLKEERFKVILITSSVIFILFKYDVFQGVNGFGKQGFVFNIGGCLFFILFSLLPLDNINKKITIILKQTIVCIEILKKFIFIKKHY